MIREMWTRGSVIALAALSAIAVVVCDPSNHFVVNAEDSKPTAEKTLLPLEEGYGRITGQVVFDGTAPKLDPAVTDKDPKAADLKVCGVSAVPSEKLVVNPKNNGIANVFVYLAKSAKVHPKLKASASKTVDFDNINCQFVPHALVVRNDQTVKILSQDAFGHNTHTNPLRNQPFNSAIKPKEVTGVVCKDVKVAEKLPVKVTCDIHPWMNAWWLILDHPYAAVTDADGKFVIDGLPAGDYDFIVWQESVGYINRTLKVKVASKAETPVATIKVEKSKFKL